MCTVTVLRLRSSFTSHISLCATLTLLSALLMRRSCETRRSRKMKMLRGIMSPNPRSNLGDASVTETETEHMQKPRRNEITRLIVQWTYMLVHTILTPCCSDPRPPATIHGRQSPKQQYRAISRSICTFRVPEDLDYIQAKDGINVFSVIVPLKGSIYLQKC